MLNFEFGIYSLKRPQIQISQNVLSNYQFFFSNEAVLVINILTFKAHTNLLK